MSGDSSAAAATASVAATNGFKNDTGVDESLQDGLSCAQLFANAEGLTYK